MYIRIIFTRNIVLFSRQIAVVFGVAPGLRRFRSAVKDIGIRGIYLAFSKR
jgi:hypothetical protein